MTTSDSFPDILLELCRNQPLAVLATAAGTAPYTNLVAVVFALDLHHLFLSKHQHLTDFVAAPDCALFQVTIEQIYLVTHFQEVMKFDFSTKKGVH